MVVFSWARTGGLEGVTIDIARSFRDLGWEIDVWAVHDTNPHVEEGIRSIPLSPAAPLAKQIYHRWRWTYRLRDRLIDASPRYDLVLVGHVELLRGWPDPTPRPLPPTWLWTYGLEIWGDAGRRHREALRRLSRIVSISDYTRSHVEALDPGCPVSVVKCFVDPSLFVPTAEPGRIRRREVLICGRMASDERYKGHDVLFRALPDAEKRLGSALQLIVVGSGTDRPRLERLAASLGLGDAVQFRGRIPLEALIEAYQHCGVFAMPSRVVQREDGYWSGEGFGIVYIEAAACARPVIASREGGAAEAILDGESGMLVDPRSPTEVATAIATTLGDNERADQMGRKGRQLVEQAFTLERFRSDIARLLEIDGFSSRLLHERAARRSEGSR